MDEPGRGRSDEHPDEHPDEDEAWLWMLGWLIGTGRVQPAPVETCARRGTGGVNRPARPTATPRRLPTAAGCDQAGTRR